MVQKFYTSPDGKYSYWEILEVKVDKDFDDHYFPRISKIDLAGDQMTDFKVPGNKNHYLYTWSMYFDANTSTRTYVGCDEGGNDHWLAKCDIRLSHNITFT